MPLIFKYNVFLSHCSKDKPAVKALAERLQAEGLRVWFDEEDVPQGMSTRKTEKILRQSRTLVLVMSNNITPAEWVSLEQQTRLFREPDNTSRRFVPLLLDESGIKDRLKQFAYVDWRSRSPEQYQKLLAICRPPISSRKSKTPQSRTFRGHDASVVCVAISLDGKIVASGSEDKTARVWDVATGSCLATLNGHLRSIYGLAIIGSGRQVLTGSFDRTIRLWDVDTGQCIRIFEGHSDLVMGLSATADGRLFISGSHDNTVRIWDAGTGECLSILTGHTEAVYGVVVTPDGKIAVSGSRDQTIRVWEIRTGNCIRILHGHSDYVYGVAITPDARSIISSSYDRTIRVWNLDSGECTATFEGHTDKIYAVAADTNGWRVVSGSYDNTVRVWDVDGGKCIARLDGHRRAVYGVAISGDGTLAVSGSVDGTVRIWTLPESEAITNREPEPARYTNAKVLLVGESGVGKSGLAIRLTQNRFEPTISTDAAWATQLKLPNSTENDGNEREIWLWDFAGQADYRLVHQLFMDETALAVLVFNPQSQDPFDGLGQWDRDLTRAARRPFTKLLVAGRCDRGGLMVSRERMLRFCHEHNFNQYFETSAYSGEGCQALCDGIITNIQWDLLPWTASPRIFKLLKEEIVKLKDEGIALLRIGELRQHLEVRLPGESFTVEQLRAVVGLLAGPGVVWQLEFGDFVLLHPERINAYAAALIRKVRAHLEEIGVILEESVLRGDLDFQDMKRLAHGEEEIVLRAMHQTFVDHGLCLREPTEAGTLLIFPSYFKRERPELEGHPAPLVTYRFNGALNEIYATLVVRLHHTTAFEKDDLWQFAADFKTHSGRRVGLKMEKLGEGSAEIAVYFESDVSDDLKVTFIRYVHEHLRARAQGVVRLRHYICTHCGTPVENRKTALERLARGLRDIICVNCEKRISLWDLIEERFASEDVQRHVKELEALARNNIDNESKELILVGHAFAIAGEAGQIFRPTPNSDWGIDGEIEFKNDKGEASGQRVYLQLKSGDSYLKKRRDDGAEVFLLKKHRHLEYWQLQAYPVMLVIRTSDGQIRWMNVTDYLRKGKLNRQIAFEGEAFTALNLLRMRNRVLSLHTKRD
ncbi:MAG TPA: TIR domain-containing protein [Pyrinomonadaceae bacterium]